MTVPVAPAVGSALLLLGGVVLAAGRPGDERLVAVVGVLVAITTMLAGALWWLRRARVMVEGARLVVRTWGRERSYSPSQLAAVTRFSTDSADLPGAWHCFSTHAGGRVLLASERHWAQADLARLRGALGLELHDQGQIPRSELLDRVPAVPRYLASRSLMAAALAAYVIGVGLVAYSITVLA